jgi:hypothetical protein
MTEHWLPQIFYGEDYDILDVEPLNVFFNENGYRSTALLKNLGSSLIYLVIIFIAWVIYLTAN